MGNFIERLGNNVELELVKIQAGQFWMGLPEHEAKLRYSEGPRHLVNVPEFWLGKYPVTQAQWTEVASLPMIEQDLQPCPSRFKGATLPVDTINWHEAMEFCQRLSQATGRTYRLPSEAEWEYACRAGTTTRYAFGDTITGEQVNCNCQQTVVVGNGFMGLGKKVEKQGIYRQKTTPVGSFLPNAWGLYDMHGNVLEWCADHWHNNYMDAPTDGSPWLSADNLVDGDISSRLMRGGCWKYTPWACWSARRAAFLSESRYDITGFRVACSVPKIFH